MDWVDPTRAVTPTLDGAVLAVLAGVTEPLTGREVFRRACRGSSMGMYRVLVRLEEQGVVHSSDAGPARLYLLNREHVAADVAVALASLRGRLFERIRSELESWEIRPVSAALFGSVARGDGDVNSDIDLFLVRPDGVEDDDERWAGAVFTLGERVLAWTGNPTSVLQAHPAEIEAMVSRGEAVVESLRNDAIDLAGSPIRDLLVTRSPA